MIRWKQKGLLELQQIKECDSFIDRCNNTIKNINKFGGYINKKLLHELAVAWNIREDDIGSRHKQDASVATAEKTKMIFISHSAKDKDYVSAFVELLEDIGLRENEIVCSSIPPYCIPLNHKVDEWLADKFQNYKLYVICMLSHNYYGSAASLNEMGAAWAMKQKGSAILLPGFGFDQVSGFIDSNQIGIKLDDSDTATLKYRLGELKEIFIKEFSLRSMSSAIWERRRDEFLNKIADIKEK